MLFTSIPMFNLNEMLQDKYHEHVKDRYSQNELNNINKMSTNLEVSQT